MSDFFVQHRNLEVLYQSGVPSSHTGDTDETNLAQILVPGNRMGANGALILLLHGKTTGTGGNKTYRIKFGGTTLATIVPTTNPTEYFHVYMIIQNNNDEKAQKTGFSYAIYGVDISGQCDVDSAVDTTIDNNVDLTVQLANAGDVAEIDNRILELSYYI